MRLKRKQSLRAFMVLVILLGTWISLNFSSENRSLQELFPKAFADIGRDDPAPIEGKIAIEVNEDLLSVNYGEYNEAEFSVVNNPNNNNVAFEVYSGFLPGRKIPITLV